MNMVLQFPNMVIPFVGKVAPILPEMMLMASTLLLLVVNVCVKQFKSMVMPAAQAGLVLLTTLILVLAQFSTAQGHSFGGMMVHDQYAVLFKAMVLLAALIAVATSVRYNDTQTGRQFEFYILMLLATLGMLVMIAASDLLTLYIGLELQSLCLYVLAAFQRDERKSNEAGLKYFVLGALSSGLLLYGISLLYGVVGSTSYEMIYDYIWRNPEASLPMMVAVVFMLAGLAFKLSAAPFHMWTPDVYEGAPTTATAFFAVAPKLAAFAMLMRLLIQPFGQMDDVWQQIVLLLSALSMLTGAFGALRQQSLKRLFAFSSIGHMGYALMGLALNGASGISASVYYLLVYAAMNVGAFACILSLQNKHGYIDRLDDIKGLVKEQPALAYAFGILLLSMAGLPFFAGFVAKFYLFDAVVYAGYVKLAVIGVLSSLVAAYYYLRLCRLMFFDAPIASFVPVNSLALGIVIVISTVFSLGFIVYPASDTLDFVRILIGIWLKS